MAQTHELRELIILDDHYRDFPEFYNRKIRYFVLKDRMTTGAKRNYINDLALGEFIAHWDDDDWYAPDRLEDQLARIRRTGKPITGYSPILYWDMINNNAKTYEQIGGGHVCGNSLFYRKEQWKRNPFPDKQVASDTDFINSQITEIAAARDETKMVARIHQMNTSAKSNIKIIVEANRIPLAFWKNQDLVRQYG